MLLAGYLAGQREFTREDGEMVAREMHDETIDADVVPDSHAAPPADTVKGAAPRRPAGEAGRLQLDAKSADEATRLLAKMQSDPLDERMTRLERRADTIVALLQQLLDAVRPHGASPAPPPAPKKQVKP